MRTKLRSPVYRLPLALDASKTAPPASRYDDPGFPYARLLAGVGCSSGPASFFCLQKVPFEVRLVQHVTPTH